MRSMQIINWGEPLELRESETPKPAGSEVLVRVKSCGICHSDLHIWEGFFDLGNGQKFPIEDRGVHLPFTLGHEAAGIVVAMGPEAKGVEVGDSYAIYPWINCGECEPCENGLTQICDAPKIIGTRVNGAYSDYVLVPDIRINNNGHYVSSPIKFHQALIYGAVPINLHHNSKLISDEIGKTDICTCIKCCEFSKDYKTRMLRRLTPRSWDDVVNELKHIYQVVF